jgi:hypothetical protein
MNVSGQLQDPTTLLPGESLLTRRIGGPLGPVPVLTLMQKEKSLALAWNRTAILRSPVRCLVASSFGVFSLFESFESTRYIVNVACISVVGLIVVAIRSTRV